MSILHCALAVALGTEGITMLDSRLLLPSSSLLSPLSDLHSQ